jgi:hypothetical protein
MRDCWQWEATRRPTFQEIHYEMENMFQVSYSLLNVKRINEDRPNVELLNVERQNVEEERRMTERGKWHVFFT